MHALTFSCIQALRYEDVADPVLTSPHDPIVYREARGANVLDVDGNRFVDLVGGFGAALLGHSHPRVVTAVQSQAARLLHALGDVYPSEEKLRLEEALAGLAPWPARVILGLSGADAVEAALKTARLATGRSGVVAFHGGYHGLSYGTLAACGYKDAFRAPFAGQLNPAVRFAPYPDGAEVSAERALSSVEALLGSGEVGAHESVNPLCATNGQVVLCRTTAPLVTSAYRLIAQGRRAVVLGREIGQGLISLVKKMGLHENADVDLAVAKIDAWCLKEVARHVDREDRQEAARDRAECIRVLADMLPETARRISDLYAAIERIFSDTQAAGGVTLSTIHKSKGLEWDEVTILNWSKMPASWARREWQRKQELHCAYVAVTRARCRLVLCDAEDFEPKAA